VLQDEGNPDPRALWRGCWDAWRCGNLTSSMRTGHSLGQCVPGGMRTAWQLAQTAHVMLLTTVLQCNALPSLQRNQAC
jgi:hypothetical protein